MKAPARMRRLKDSRIIFSRAPRLERPEAPVHRSDRRHNHPMRTTGSGRDLSKYWNRTAAPWSRACTICPAKWLLTNDRSTPARRDDRRLERIPRHPGPSSARHLNDPGPGQRKRRYQQLVADPATAIIANVLCQARPPGSLYAERGSRSTGRATIGDRSRNHGIQPPQNSTTRYTSRLTRPNRAPSRTWWR
jgi:hypothetical protein